MSSIVSYEVMVFKDGHWSIAFITADRDEALLEARSAEAGKHAKAVKVVQETTDQETGDERSKIIYNSESQDTHAHAHAHAHGPKEGGKNHAEDKKGKKELHPEVVTNFIDSVRKLVLVFGGIVLLLVVLVLLYLSNPGAVSGFLEGLFN